MIRFMAALLACTCLTSGLGQLQPRTEFTVDFKHLATSRDPNAAGTVRVETLGSLRRTTLTLKGLAPRTVYAAHYHALAPNYTGDPCLSNGPVTVGFPTFTSDSQGRATTTMLTATKKIADNAGAYINVHVQRDLSIIPLCAVMTGSPSSQPAATNAPNVNVPTPNRPLTQTIRIVDNAFQPKTLTIAVGTTVEWTNQGRVSHNVLSTTGAFGSDDLPAGSTFRHTFTRAGTFPYYCSYHEGMAATIVVTGP
ncbi:plastocyanin/azurin family copper-binding protein [Deinococcus yavapaiensis]|uniref:Plastocyanin n=1 Tax=Deinococcus yavapaiensis KR-236 TaxID=694435 RepID=A0A318SHM2_9DEIO|nr:plastocyanin/azurin family copper-binding protein [Deinococcus yavapaiensis]PYE50522.1 plastocyanin [Deinococcus yavapaiensis KR-236]